MAVDSPIDPLEGALADLASRIEITDIDAFAAATMVKVRRGRDDDRRRRTFSLVRGPQSRQLLAVAAVILLVASAVLAVPRSRDAIADLFGIDGLRIRSEEGPVPSTTATSASTTSASTPTVATTAGGGSAFDALAVGRDLKLGAPVTLAVARTALPALRELQSAYGPPDAIYRGDRPSGLVTFVWRARPGLAGSTTAPTVGLVLQQYPGNDDIGFFLKSLSSGSRAREVVVEGKRGYWVDGAPHSIAYVDANSTFVDDTVRWASNALVWANNRVTYRIESALTQDEALALVSSLK